MTPLKTIIKQQQEKLPEGYKRFSTSGEQTPSDLIVQTATEGYLAGLRTALEVLPETAEENKVDITAEEQHRAYGHNTCRQIIKDHIEAKIAEVEGKTE